MFLMDVVEVVMTQTIKPKKKTETNICIFWEYSDSRRNWTCLNGRLYVISCVFFNSIQAIKVIVIFTRGVLWL